MFGAPSAAVTAAKAGATEAGSCRSRVMGWIWRAVREAVLGFREARATR